jgi:transposase
MEATGVYWKPVWHILEGRFQQILANAAHIKGVPGRRSDMNDATWIADLLAHGLIRASFVPPQPIQELRDLTRTRKQLTREIVQHTQRIQAVLEEANIKLSSVIADIRGPKKAAVAVAASILTTAYHMLADGTCYQDLGADHFARRNPSRAAAKLANRIRNLGFHVEIRPAA